MQTPLGHDKPAKIAPGTPLDPPVHILVVDDDESNRESLGRRLTRHGYTVITASDG